jgi:hypothetical protein
MELKNNKISRKRDKTPELDENGEILFNMNSDSQN